MRTISRFCIIVLLGLFAAPPAGGYSLLTHEQLIDLTWDSSIVPLLKSRYPTLTDAQIAQARAYAYGGCVIQDIGYYPFGDPFFSNLTHYVRSGDFVVNLFRNAKNANELAFAVGALSHFIGDSIGHATATNLAVPVEFPTLGQRFGKSVSYAQGKSQHVRTEFGFDVNEIAHRHLAPVHYLRHVGLEVPQRQLEQAFYQTYGLAEDFSAGRGKRINVKGYRFAVRNFIPRVAYAVTLLHRHSEPPVVDSPELQQLTAQITAVAIKNDWNHYRRKAGIGTYTLAGLLWILPKLGPIKLAAVKGPTMDTNQEYLRSVLHSVDLLNATLRRFTPPGKTGAEARPTAAIDTYSHLPSSDSSQASVDGSGDPHHPLRNRDLDTGAVVRPSGYPLTDDTYCALLHRLVAKPTQPIPFGIKQDILAYYADINLPFSTRRHSDQWKILQADLATLRTISTSEEPLPFPTYGPDTESPSAKSDPSEQ